MIEQGISFQNVTKRFGRLEAVRNLSLDIPHGSFVSIIGPSGCGKTTTLRMIAGFETPNEGRILLDGADISRLPANRRNVSMVFQHYALFPHMNVYRNVEYGLRMRKVEPAERKKRVERALALLEIEDLKDEPTNRISGGQQQKVGLARALVTEPKIILLDEPMGAIDEALRVRTQRELRHLFERLNITFIHVTHNQHEAFAMADRIIVMNEGEVVQDDTPETLFRAPESDFVARFVGRNNIFAARVLSVEEKAAEVETSLGTFRLATDRPIPEPGSRVAFSVRADLLDLTGPANGVRVNSIEGEITFVEDIETVKIYHLQAADGTVVRLETHGREEGEGLAAGRRITVGFRPRDAVLLRFSG